MIPLKLRLHNFMCYRDEQTLDFSGIHLACLAGDNGHGKSALLDAITWALWGRSRARRDDELIALGETEVWVEFEFGLGRQRYRVWRQRSKKGRGQSDLHFYIWNPTPGIEPLGGLGVRPAEASTPDDSGDWQLLDDGGLVERQAQIIRTLRLDYETFVNSAFLLQGRADSFTVKTASERKQILADILGLGRYDLYEERAKQEAQARKDQATRIGGEIAGIDAELARRADFESRLQAARVAAAQGVAALRAAEADQAGARLAVQERQALARQLADLRHRLSRAERDLADGRNQLDAAIARLGQFEAVLAQRSEIEAGWAELQQARAEDAAWNTRLLRHTQVSERFNRARLAVDQARLAVEAEHRRLVERQAELGRKVAAGQEQARALAEAQVILAHLAGQQGRRDVIAAELREIGERSAGWQAEQRRFSERDSDLRRKIAIGQEQTKLLVEVQAILAHMVEQQGRRDAIASELREVGEQAAGVRAEMDRAKAEGQSANYKRALLQTGEAAACPLCGQALTPEHQGSMVADLVVEHDALAERYRTLQAELKKLLDCKSALESEDTGLARDLRTRDARQHQAAQAEAAVVAGESAVAEFEVLADRQRVAQTELQALSERKAALEAEDALLARDLRARDARQRQAAQAEAAVVDGVAAADEQARIAAQTAERAACLADGDYAPAERAELARLQAELADIGYDAATHEAVRTRAQALEPFDARYGRQLLPALDGVADARARADALAAQQARREAELADDQAESARLTAAVADLPGLEAALRRVDALVEQAAAGERRARLEEGAAQQQLGALLVLEERRKLRAADLERVNAETSVYNQLREAFGKKGLQAMIIESAIPEVEIEANRLLARMSDNRMSLRLETQREKVTGGVAETLDIIISDELGARAYEMFSGGESFRANLALRIAISKLLARRAGAQLQTLVIDEGFGSQDSQGRSLVVEAINSIQHDFERIIVITHIDELKDLFPARIDVVKTASGSRVTIA